MFLFFLFPDILFKSFLIYDYNEGIFIYLFWVNVTILFIEEYHHVRKKLVSLNNLSILILTKVNIIIEVEVKI